MRSNKQPSARRNFADRKLIADIIRLATFAAILVQLTH